MSEINQHGAANPESQSVFGTLQYEFNIANIKCVKIETISYLILSLNE